MASAKRTPVRREDPLYRPFEHVPEAAGEYIRTAAAEKGRGRNCSKGILPLADWYRAKTSLPTRVFLRWSSARAHQETGTRARCTSCFQATSRIGDGLRRGIGSSDLVQIIRGWARVLRHIPSSVKLCCLSRLLRTLPLLSLLALAAGSSYNPRVGRRKLWRTLNW